MARSSTIWVVSGNGHEPYSPPLAVFTVKWECAKWCKAYVESFEKKVLDPEAFVYKMSDGDGTRFGKSKGEPFVATCIATVKEFAEQI